jgi:aryl-alcohol dehydrogenase-like predicted oxidoreductase
VDFRSRLGRLSGDAVIANQSIADTVKSVADAKGVRAAQIALAWCTRRVSVSA